MKKRMIVAIVAVISIASISSSIALGPATLAPEVAAMSSRMVQ